MSKLNKLNLLVESLTMKHLRAQNKPQESDNIETILKKDKSLINFKNLVKNVILVWDKIWLSSIKKKSISLCWVEKFNLLTKIELDFVMEHTVQPPAAIILTIPQTNKNSLTSELTSFPKVTKALESAQFFYSMFWRGFFFQDFFFFFVGM